MKLVGCKSALNPSPTPTPMVYSTDRSKVVVPVLLFVLCGLFYEAICFKSQKRLPLETKNTQNHENRRLGLIESLHVQPCSLRGCIHPLAPA